MRLATAGMVVGLVACTAFEDASVAPAAGAGGTSGQSGGQAGTGASGKGGGASGAGAGGVGGKGGQGGASGGSPSGGKAGQAGSGGAAAGTAGQGGGGSTGGGSGGAGGAGQGGTASGGTGSGGAGAGGEMSGASGQTGAGTGQGGDPGGQGGGGMLGGGGAGQGSGAMGGAGSGAGGANPCGSTLESDPANCGECGRVCGSGVCQQGGCLMNSVLQVDGMDPMINPLVDKGLYVATTQGMGVSVVGPGSQSSMTQQLTLPIRGVVTGATTIGVLSGGDNVLVFPLSLAAESLIGPSGTMNSPPMLSPFRGIAYSPKESMFVWTGRQGTTLNWQSQKEPLRSLSVPKGENRASGVAVLESYAYYLTGSGLYRANLTTKEATLFAPSKNEGSSVVMFDNNTGVLWAEPGFLGNVLRLKSLTMSAPQTLAEVSGSVVDLVTSQGDTYALITNPAGSYVARVDPSGALVPRARLPQGMTGTSLGVDATYVYAAASTSKGSAVVRGER